MGETNVRTVHEMPDPIAAAADEPRTVGHDRWSVWLWAVLALGALLRLTTAALPERLLLRVTVDDALYYTGVARHLGAGEGFSFDGIHATNGFHPLWALLITPLTWFTEGTALLRLMAVLQAVLAVATFVLLARLLRPLLGTFATTVGLAVWWLSPHSVLHGQSGVEATLAACCVALLITAAVTYDRRPSTRLAVWAGVAAGACFLARSDTAFAVLAVGGWLIVRQVRTGRDTAGLVRHAGAAGGVAAAVIAPWWAWNLASFGTITQDSFWARPQVEWQRRLGDTAPGPGDVVEATFGYLSDRWLLESGWPPVLVLVGGVIAGALVVRAGFATGWPRHLAALGGALLSAGAVLAVVHGGVRMLARGYYFEWVRMSLGLFTAAVVAGIVAGPARRTVAARVDDVGLRRLAVGVLATVVVLGTLLGVDGLRTPGYPWQGHMVAAGRWIEEHTEPDDVVVTFNAGIVAEYSGRTVVNVDGVINHEAADALSRRELADHLCSTGASWLVDFDPVVLEEYEPFMGEGLERIELEQIAVIEDPAAAPYGPNAMTAFRFRCDG